MRHSNGNQNGIFHPQEIEEMAKELNRWGFPGNSQDDREMLAAAIIQRKLLEHKQAKHESQRNLRGT